MGSDAEDAATDLKEKLLYSIQSLNEIGEELSSIEEFASSSRAVLHLVMGTLVISKAAIMIYDERSGELAVSASRGLADTALRLELPPGMVRALHAAREPFFVDDPPDPAIAEFFADHAGELEALHSHIWAPLRVKRGLLGVVSVSRKFMKGEYEEVDLELLNIIVQQLSIGFNTFRLISSLREINFQLNRKILELETLYDLGIAIGGLMEVPELCELILINAVGLTDASVGLLALKTDGGLELASSINLPSDDILTLESYEPVMAVLDGEPLRDNAIDPASNPFGFSKALVVPLRGQHGVQGLIGLADKESRDGGLVDFGEEDQRLLLNFASQAGIAIENAKFYAESVEKERLERELQVAATIQRNLLPDSPPCIPGFEIAATTIPCRTVGGDHYDFLEQDGRHLISIADVSGKGIPAALLVSTLHATLHAIAEDERDLRALVGRISRSIFASSLSNKFITFVISRLDPERMTFSYVNAGHNYPLVVSADGSINLLQSGGLCLGLLPQAEYQEEVVQLRPGDLVVLYTDGITEAFDPQEEEFGEERLTEILLRERHRSAREIFDAIMSAVDDFTAGAPQHDDLTLLVCKVSQA